MKNEKENDKNKKVKTPNNKQKKKENTEGKNPMKNSRDNTQKRMRENCAEGYKTGLYRSIEAHQNRTIGLVH